MTDSMIKIRSKPSLEASVEDNLCSCAEPILITGPSPTIGFGAEKKVSRLVDFGRQKHQ